MIDEKKLIGDNKAETRPKWTCKCRQGKTSVES